MNDYIKTITYKFNKVLSKYDILYLQSKLVLYDGINAIDITPETINVEYITAQQTEESVKELIENTGYPLRNEKKKQSGLFKRFITNLAETNKKTFGDKKLDCCDLKH